MNDLQLRFMTFNAGNGAQPGIETTEGVVDLLAAQRLLVLAGLLDPTVMVPDSLLGIIEAGEPALAAVQQLLALINAGADVASAHRLVGSFEWLAPIPLPRQNVLCLGINYADHLAEAEQLLGLPVEDSLQADASGDAKPPLTMFSKRPNTVSGHHARIPLHAGITEQLDYEAELAFVMGRQGCNLSVAEAEDYLFGYTIINEVSARDLQVRHMQVFKGKSLDGYCPTGPVLVHKSAMVRTPAEGLVLRSRINGELRHDTSTAKLLYDVPTSISILSEGMTLYPGDIIATGNPWGSGISYDPPKYLNAGDTVEIEIEGIGVLSNQVAQR